MASQLEKQLGVPAGKYTNAQLARLKAAKEGGNQDFRKAKKAIDGTAKPAAKPTTKTKTATAKAKPAAKKITTRPKARPAAKPAVRPKARPSGTATASKTTTPKQSKAPTAGTSPKVSAKKDGSPNRTAPKKPATPSKTSTSKDRPVAKRMGRGYTLAQWRKMTREERKKAGLPTSELGAQAYFNIKGKS